MTAPVELPTPGLSFDGASFDKLYPKGHTSANGMVDERFRGLFPLVWCGMTIELILKPFVLVCPLG